MAGVEQDENGNLSFDPAKFALGFLGGAGGSKGIERITRLAKYPKARAAMERVRLKKDIMPKMQQGQRVEIQIQNKNFKTLKEENIAYLEGLKGQSIINKQTGIEASIARKGIKEMISNVKKSVGNGFSFNEHFAVANHLKEIFENATFAKKMSDTKYNDPRVSIYRFNCLVTFGKKEANALITLKEYLENGKRLYALELEELSKAKFSP